MRAGVTDKPIDEVIAGIQALDLASVKERVMDADAGKGWTRGHADRIEYAYKMFLTMLVKYQEEAESILLSKDVDEFWHTHILQTVKYADDCDSVFGTFVHHRPHLGAHTEEALAQRTALAEKTRQLYQREFGSAEGAVAAWAGDAIDEPRAALSSYAIRAKQAALSSYEIRENQAALSSYEIRADQAALSSYEIQADKAALSSYAIRAPQAALSSYAIRPENSALSSYAIEAGKAALSSYAIGTQRAALSSYSIRADGAAPPSQTSEGRADPLRRLD